MTDGLASLLICPVCQAPLSSDDNKHWYCANNHSFDRARQGYLNLLLAHKKRSKAPGDDAQMVAARQRLLDSGVYQPISDLLNNAVQQASANSPMQLCDVGCGEGYYTERLANHLTSNNINNRCYGVDISKEAVKSAARRSKQSGLKSEQAEWLVASGAALPFQPQSLDAITCLFTRLMPEGFRSVLKPSGTVFTINTGLTHLREMRDILYPEVKDSCFNPTKVMSQHGFICVNEQPLNYTIELTSSQQIHDLLLMTPHVWKANTEARQRLLEHEQLSLSIDVVLHQFVLSEEPDDTNGESA
ncbi:putative RNA methyltransferase [Bacterioplanoides sp. SCSIO 12839]|uniref:putative RNA methyltransferase n=1 Tax=Bacterioplanoides sp. SCSIO 12839 TaxID=2829569 RepID=UPI002101F913|nr:methyltransferase domain-containing protein [Bacterioplanoides sp. SCSIO 12839]UTW49950.1 methyltransferase domain-containing protein [Bacterioplanoides sp. SCSIO 12839]